MDNKKGKVTGIGGVFFKCKDTATVKEWYQQNLGIKTDEYGSMFESRDTNNPEQKTYLQWSPFPDNTKYFNPSEKDFMINYRVENIEGLIEQLKSSGVKILDSLESYDYGKFIHILDPEGNKIELWEPADSAFTKE
ncbi:MAG: VOC family protein [Chlorobi bacterium]|nr:VOC family protein [Chlorobiota bacterium]